MLFLRFSRVLVAGSLLVVLAACSGVQREELPSRDDSQPQDSVEILLSQAESDLLRDRLMYPVGGNAYDRFQAVLILRPEHPQAISGIQQVLIRYVTLGREALAKSKPDRAVAMLAAAKRVDANNPLVMELELAIESEASGSEAESGTEFLLPLSELSARGDAIKSRLKLYADRVRKTGESVLIVARTDGEGRWLYQQLRIAASGYRVRGDIRIGAEPKIVLLSPLG